MALLQCTPHGTALLYLLTVVSCTTMVRGEVITLQFGTFANYVGAHYWNIQVHLWLRCTSTARIAGLHFL